MVQLSICAWIGENAAAKRRSSGRAGRLLDATGGASVRELEHSSHTRVAPVADRERPDGASSFVARSFPRPT
eukprot:12985604-Alexandrium_andersonii.AAC.1